MKVGLIRHFRVKQSFPAERLITPDQLAQWYANYDIAEIEEGGVDLQGHDWKRCYVSDLPRAERTARLIYDGEITVTPELREVHPYPFGSRRLRLPFMLWAILGRVCWFFHKKAPVETRSQVERRVAALLDRALAAKEDVLIVSHAALMLFLRRELIRRGFHGPTFAQAANGRLYLFER